VAVVSLNWHGRDFSSSNEPPTNVHELVECSNDFSFEMYRELAGSGDENIFFSPYSITTALGMAYEGAGGDTAAEMAHVLNFPTDNQTRLDIMKAFQTGLNADNDAYELATANAYWLRQGENLDPDYRDAIESYYLAHGEELDFAGDPTGSADAINSWVEAQTHDRIKDLISPGDIQPETYLVLTNAIYFYEKALTLAPNDKDIKYNLNIAQQYTTDKIKSIEPFFLKRFYQNLISVFSVNQWANISLYSFVAVLIFVLLFLFLRNISLKKLFFWTGIILLLLSISSLIFSFSQKKNLVAHQTGIVFSPTVNIKSSPDEQGTDLMIIHEGIKVTVVDSLQDWYNVILPDGNEGWLKKDNIKKI
jgi:hypothetical protein